MRNDSVLDLAERQSYHLGQLHARQAELANVCRRDGTACAESMLTLERQLRDATSRETVRQSQMASAYTRLSGMIDRLVGKTTAVPGVLTDDDVRALIAVAEAAKASGVEERLAELELLMVGDDGGGPIGALAKREVIEVRSDVERGMLDARIEEARAAILEPRVGITEEVQAAVNARTQWKLDRYFEMGAVEPLWRGIENLLPEGVPQMPEVLLRVAEPKGFRYPAP